MAEHFDVLIVGAGLSGIAAAHHLQAQCPSKTYAILEARDVIGGTWDLFRYPGVRSDSDMYTLGYSFRPWKDAKSIADGAAILQYVRDTADERGITPHIRFQHRVQAASWSTPDARWTLAIANPHTDTSTTLTCSFVILCSGYYNYAKGYTPDLPGQAAFGGRLVHPQHWPQDLDYRGQRIVVIGSGATAVTLVPELAKQAAHVTMLQRSPTYVISVPSRDRIADWLRAKLPAGVAHHAARWKNVIVAMATYQLARRFPERAAKLLMDLAAKELGDSVDVDVHFKPTYKPWDQRLCLIPDADLFKALKAGQASIVTDHIATFDATGIQLKSGAHLDADLVVTATGLQLELFGGAALDIDGVPVKLADLVVYKGIMCSGVPNLAFAVGYTNASWTLKADLTAQYVARLINYMDAKGFSTCIPRRDPTVTTAPILDFSSGYVTRALDQLPRQGDTSPWKLFQNYALDLLLIRHSRIADGTMEFSRGANVGVPVTRAAVTTAADQRSPVPA